MDEFVKIIVVDDHPSYLEGVSLLLQSVLPNTKIVTALNGAGVRAQLAQHPDVHWVLLDINLPDCSGLDLIKHFKDIKLLANIIVITSDDNPDIIDKALRLKVNGFLTKDFDSQVLSQCIRTIENDKIFLVEKHSQLLKNYRENLLREKKVIEETISQRQKQTLVLIAKGYSNNEIANTLGISESTVKTHVSSLIALFDADNRTHCVAEARRLQFVE